MHAGATSASSTQSGTTDHLLRSAAWRIYYKEIPVTWWRVKNAFFYVSPDHDDIGRGLRLDIRLGFAKNSDWAGFPQGQVRACLHHSVSSVTEPSDGSLLDAPFPATIREGSLAGVLCYFPWATNALEEGFVDVRLGETHYGLELPYGFTGDPRMQQGVPTEPARGKVLKALPMPEETQRVRWTSIHYDLGEIENNCRLLLLISNRVETAIEMTLYRDQSKYWDLASPACAVSIKDSDGTVLQGARIAQNRPDVYRRAELYDFGRVSGSASTGWGALLVAVGQQRYELVVPRSVYAHAP